MCRTCRLIVSSEWGIVPILWRMGPRAEGGEVNSPGATTCPLAGYPHPATSRPGVWGCCLMVCEASEEVRFS